MKALLILAIGLPLLRAQSPIPDTTLVKDTLDAVNAALATKASTATTVNGHALSGNVNVTASDVGLGAVTNDAQTKAAIVPNTPPAAGKILVGNAGGTAYAPVSISGSCSMTSAGVMSCAGGGTIDDFRTTKISGTVITVAAGTFRYGTNVAVIPGTGTFTMQTVAISSISTGSATTINTSTPMTNLVDGQAIAVQLSGTGAGCAAGNGVFVATALSTSSFQVPVDTSAGCTSVSGTVGAQGGGSLIIFGNSSGQIELSHSSAMGALVSASGVGMVVSQTSTGAFPNGSTPIASGTVAAGAFDTVTDKRAFLSNMQVQSGAGIDVTMVGGQAQVAVAPNVPLTDAPSVWLNSVVMKNALKTLPWRTGTGSPDARDNCLDRGEAYFQTDTPRLWACTLAGTPGTWTVTGGGTTTVNGQACAIGSSCTVADSTKVPTTTTVNGHALSGNVSVTATDVSLGSVTNDVQTKAAIVPNTAPSAGQILAGNAGGTAYAPVSISGSCSMTSAGVMSCAGGGTTTVNGQACTIGSTCTVADSTKVPTTTTVNGHALSGNVSVTATDVSLGSVTNDVQTKAAIVPNTAPAAGQILAGNAGGTAYAPVTISGSCSMTSAGVMSCSGGPYPYVSGTFSSSTHATITAATHGFSTKGLAVMVYDTSGNLLAPDGNSGNPITVNPSTYQVDVYFASAATFIVAINGGVGQKGDTGATGATGPAGSGSGSMTDVTATAPLTGGTSTTSLTIGAGNLPKRSSCVDFGSDNATSDLTDPDLGPQVNIFKIPAAATIIEISAAANAGTPSLPIMQKNHWGGSSWAATDITSAVLPTGASGIETCAATGAACISGVTKSGSVTIVTAASANVIAAGDYIQTKIGSSLASAGAKRLTVCVTYTVN